MKKLKTWLGHYFLLRIKEKSNDDIRKTGKKTGVKKRMLKSGS